MFSGEEDSELGREQEESLPPQVPGAAGEAGEAVGPRTSGQLCAQAAPETHGPHPQDGRQAETEKVGKTAATVRKGGG